VLHKVFPGGYITVIGANSAAGLASRPIRVILADELDRWGKSAGTEGDPLSLAEARTITYRHRRKVVKVSTPGNEAESRIETEWERSDQRHFEVPCPFCGHVQPLEWRDSGGKSGIKNARGRYRLVWEKVENTGKAGENGSLEGSEGTIHRPETAKYQCRACDMLIPETAKPEMLALGRWVKHNPTSDRAGFHISGLLSPWVRWSEIASDWLAKKDDPEQRKTFFNTKLGLLYSDEGEIPDASSLSGRREQYAAEVPVGVGVLTAAIDVQGDRLEVLVVGWGEGEECWVVRLERIYGNPEESEVWERAETLLVRGWQHESGAVLRVQACMVDSGYLTDSVYAFVRPRQLRRVYAAKGNDNAKQPLSRSSRANRDKVKVFTYNPSHFKDRLFARLRRVAPGRGYVHFGTREQAGLDEEFFRQFSAERRVVEYEGGRYVVRYINPKKARNEAIDLYVGNLTALRSLGMGVSESLGRHAKRVGRAGAARKEAALAEQAALPPEEPEEPPEPPEDGPAHPRDPNAGPRVPTTPPRPARRAGFARRWR
jgi:phage terminase large subunit GpA-like protein